MPLERVVQLTHEGVRYTFRVDPDPPLSFWRVEIPGREPCRSTWRVMGDEGPGFFEALAREADEAARPQP